MKKALLAAVCFILISLLMINGTFALPDLNQVFSDLTEKLGDILGKPIAGGEGTSIHVALDSDEEPRRLYPGGEASCASRVSNLGTGDVYFRLVYAVQYDEESWDQLTIRFISGDGFEEHPWKTINVSGTPYKMKVFTYTKALPASELSPEVEIFIHMDASVTSEQVARYRNDFLKIQVLAIDPAPFIEKGYATAKEALDMALPIETLSPF